MAKDKAPKKEKEVKSAPAAKSQGQEAGVPPRFYESYKKEIRQALKEKFQFKSISQVPMLEKISINVGVGQATQDPKLIELVVKDLETIVGQKPVVTRAKKAISNFKLREGMPVGVRVTLRSKKMYEFFDRLINVALPRVRDFRGLSDKSFDGRGNYTIGVKEQIIFPEIDVDKITKVFGMDITFVTTAKTDQHAYELLKSFGLPFVKPQ
jgi:large subunit ribosomal protein L5